MTRDPHEKTESPSAWYRELFDHAGDAIFVHDLEGNFLDVNDTACRRLGYARDELLDMGPRGIDDPEHAARIRERIDEIRRIGRAVFETVHVTKDGRPIPVEISSRRIDYQGQPAVLSVARDISVRKDAETALRKERDFAESLVETAQTIVLVLDRKGRIVRYNPYMEALTGRPLHETHGRDWFDTFLPGEDHDRIRRLFQEAVSENDVHANVNPILDREGRLIYVEWNSTTLKGPGNEIMGVLATGTDITDRMENELALEHALQTARHREAEVTALLESARAILENRKFLPTAKRIFDACKKQIGAKSGYVALLSDDGEENEVLFLDAGDRPCTVDPELPMPIRGLREGAYRTGKAVFDNDFAASPHVGFLPEGHVALDNVMFAPLRLNGATAGIIGLANKEGGFTEDDARLATAFGELASVALMNSRFLETLEASEEKYRSFLEDFQGIAYRATLSDWRPEYFHGAVEKITGYAEEEFLSGAVRWDRILHPHDLARIIEEDTPRLANEPDVRIDREYRITHRDGSERWLRDFIHNVSDDEGRLRFVQGSVYDMTEKKRHQEQQLRLEEQLRHAQKLESLGVLAGGIAHDFNNLLMGILGNADLALDDLSPGSSSRASIHRVVTSAKRAADLCRQMLAYSGKGRFVVEPVDLNAVVTEMAELLEISVSKKAVLKLELGADLPLVEADTAQVRQVLMNLITNASEAIGDRSGIIRVATGALMADRAYLEDTFLDENLCEGPYVYVEVSDTGCGMDETTRDRIFDPFFTTKFTGRGLGLAAVLGIVRGHDGAIKVYSEPGKGTTFKIMLPAADAESRAEIADGRDSPVDVTVTTGSILLADDEETVRIVSSLYLKKMGFSVLLACDGREAVDCFRDHADQIACVVLDLTMPHMNGEEAFREIRRIRPDVPVILSSGYNEQEVTNRFVGRGLAGFIQKPYVKSALVEKVCEVLSNRPPNGHRGEDDPGEGEDC